MNSYPGADKVKSRIEQYCVVQDRCQQEVLDKLKTMGCNWQEAQEWLVHLISEGFVEEERFARSFVRGHFRMKSWGRILIRKHLQAKKISEQNIRIALDAEIEADEYADTLLRLAEKKIRMSGLNPDSVSERNKIFQFLLGKGYEQELISDCLSGISGKK